MSGLHCPTCGSLNDHVVRDTRTTVSGLRRRRHCACGQRFTTVEVIVSDKPRRLVGCQVRDAALDKAKAIQRVTRILEEML